MDQELIVAARPALEHGERVVLDRAIRNVHRTVGTMLSHEVTKRYGPAGLPADTIDITLRGSAGQSFGAVLAPGVTLRLHGDANDYVGKSLSGGRIVVRPDRRSHFWARHNVIAGNVVGYGATSGEMYLRGQAGERFAVRNSGATIVVEGVGDHGCEYMTGGTVVVLGQTGRNFGAGMSGGTAYVLDLDPARVNTTALASGDLLLQRPDEEDEQILAALLRSHRDETESHAAVELLEEARLAERFTKVLPRQYAAVSAALARAAEEGLDIAAPQVWESIMEATNG
jgi:glutamate synthase (NADPH/NADH) large chain